MPHRTSNSRSPARLGRAGARDIWLAAQLPDPAVFGAGPEAATRVIERLGYVQIDTINVIERCHHHILFNRLPGYRRDDLHHAQSVTKSVFEYWTHALSYVPVRDYRFFVDRMRAERRGPRSWGSTDVPPRQISKVLRRIREEGPLTISDITDDKLVDKNHPWASRKPSKAALQAAFFDGRLVVSRRQGMLKTYELTERHFGWDRRPGPATPRQTSQYLLDRALNAQGIVSLDSICHLNARAKPGVRDAIGRAVRAKRLRKVEIEGLEKTDCWTTPDRLERQPAAPKGTWILSPFDPLIIQRKRTAAILGYEHLFEAYLPREKRKLGYFTLPVLIDGAIVAALDLKADRQAGELLIQAWHWVGAGSAARHKPDIEAALEDFEKFQFAG